MREIKWSTQADGSLIGPAIHDGVIVGLELIQDQRLCLHVKNLLNVVVRLELLGIREFTLVELWNSAIVSDMYVWQARSVPDVMWQVPDGGWNALLRTRTDATNVAGVAGRIAARQPEPLLVLIDCSYGGQLAAVCKRLTITQADS